MKYSTTLFFGFLMKNIFRSFKMDNTFLYLKLMIFFLLPESEFY